MTPAQRLKLLVPDLFDTFARFPVPFLSSIGLAVLLNLDIAGLVTLSSHQEERVITALIAGFLSAGATNLFLEARPGFSSALRQIIAATVGLAFGAMVFFDRTTAVYPLFLGPGLIHAVMAAAYVGGKYSEESFWLFNARLALAIILSTAVGLVFAGGLAAILASFDYLFDVKVHGDVYKSIWTTGIALVGPIYGLSLTPGRFDDALDLTEAGTLAERGVSVLINYLMVPLLAVYVVILHLYAGKIIIEWSLPKGQVGQMVLAFVVGGTAAFLVARPWRGRGTRLSRFFLDWWFVFLVTPLALLAVGVTRRISDYGVTPERYGLVVIGIWAFALLAAWTIGRRRIASWNIVAALSVLLIATSFGPWGATGFSISSQVKHFEALLQRNGVLKNGRLAPDFDGSEKLAGGDARAGASIVAFLNRERAIDRLRPVFNGHGKDPFAGNAQHWKRAQTINTLFGFSSTAPEWGVKVVNFWSSDKASIALPEATRLTGPYRINKSTRVPTGNIPAGEIQVWPIDGDLVVASASSVWRTGIASILNDAAATKDLAKGKPAPYVHTIDGPGGQVRLIILGASGRITNDKPKSYSLSFWVAAPAR